MAVLYFKKFTLWHNYTINTMFITAHRRPHDQQFWQQALQSITQLKTLLLPLRCYYLGHASFCLQNQQVDASQHMDHTAMFRNNELTVIFSLDYTTAADRAIIAKQLDHHATARLLWIGAEMNPWQHPRTHSIFWGSEMLLQKDAYNQLPPQHKEINHGRPHWISISLGERPHRVVTAAVLMHHVHAPGELRIKTSTAQPHPTVAQYLQQVWRQPTTQLDPVVQTGYEKLCSRAWWGSELFTYGQHYQIMGHNQNNNAANFDQHLRKLYQHTTVEIVNETVCADAPVFVTEKYLNSVRGMNLPLIIAAPGTVAHLESLGLDLFRDCVNHDYDLVADPVARIQQAIQSNLALLNDPQRAQVMWQQCRTRLEKNCAWVQQHLHSFVEQHCMNDIKAFVHHTAS